MDKSKKEEQKTALPSTTTQELRRRQRQNITDLDSLLQEEGILLSQASQMDAVIG